MDRCSGKILLYNEASGEGAIVTPDKEKIAFGIAEWGDFDHLPSVGLQVTFVRSGEIAVDIAIDPEQPQNENPNSESTIHSEKEIISTEYVINSYFRTINAEVDGLAHYSSAEHAIDFGRLRRFLLTTYNNLLELDSTIRQSNVSTVKNDLTYLSGIYDEFRTRARYVKRAFHDLFLSKNKEFMEAQQKLETNKELIAQHETNIKLAQNALENLERLATQTPPTSEYYPVIARKRKAAKAKIVDEIHHKRELTEENAQLIGFIEMIINENEESFSGKFSVQARKFDEKITILINKLAYTFDTQLWQSARKSKPIKDYFRRSHIKGRLSSITYLKYYLQSLNQEKLSDENRELFEIVEYLQSLRKQTILYLSNDIDKVMRLKPAIASVDKTIRTEMTMDFDKAFDAIVTKDPSLIFVDFQGDFKKLVKKLHEHQMLEEANLVLVVEKSNDKIAELAQRMHIEHILQMQVSPLAFTHEVSRILEEM